MLQLAVTVGGDQVNIGERRNEALGQPVEVNMAVWLLGRHEAVADAPFGLDVTRSLGIIAELLP